MKPALLTSFLLFIAAASLHAQLSFLPQAGFEQSRTNLMYGNGLSASDMSSNFKAALKIDYRLKGGHSPFINITTSPAPMSFAFNNLGTLENNYQAAKANLRLRLEAGYQYSSLPIRLGKKSSSVKAPSTDVANAVAMQHHGCGAMVARSRCGNKRQMNKGPLDNMLNMRLQPALAFAYIPSSAQRINQTTDGFTYTAGTWKTAVVPSMGFEFDKGRQRLFTLTVFYTKPLEEAEAMGTISSGIKAINVPLEPTTSTWGLTVGIPFGFTKAAHKTTSYRTEVKHCERGSSYRRCSRF